MSFQVRVSFFRVRRLTTLSVESPPTANGIIEALARLSHLPTEHAIRFSYGGRVFSYNINETVVIPFATPNPVIFVGYPRKTKPTTAGVKRPRTPDSYTESRTCSVSDTSYSQALS